MLRCGALRLVCRNSNGGQGLKASIPKRSQQARHLTSFRKKSRSPSARTRKQATTAQQGCQECGVYNFKAITAYRGTAYKGWQIQNGKGKVPTIQDKLEAAISGVKNERRKILRLQGAGRTDAGVHARGQVFNFFSDKLTPPLDKLLMGINSNLPPDIRVTSCQRVPPDFNARYSALSKLYCFQLQTGTFADPFQLGLGQHVFRRLDVAAMRDAAHQLVGRHDFTQFSSVPAATRPVSPFKTLTRVEVIETPGGLQVAMDGSGFLYNQCRHMVGCLIAVGLGSLPPAEVTRLLKIGAKDYPGAADLNALLLCWLEVLHGGALQSITAAKGILGRSNAGLKHRRWRLADAEGLYLEEVRYPPHSDYTQLMYPELPHDQHGRVWLTHMTPGTERALIARMKQLT